MFYQNVLKVINQDFIDGLLRLHGFSLQGHFVIPLYAGQGLPVFTMIK